MNTSHPSPDPTAFSRSLPGRLLALLLTAMAVVTTVLVAATMLAGIEIAAGWLIWRNVLLPLTFGYPT